MRSYGLRDGLFLVRERTQVNSFALCLGHRNQIYHYLLDMNNQGQLSIENGRKFENLLQVVDHYSRTADGLLGSLGDFCPVSKFAAMESQVVHGPKRIDENEIIIQGELGETNAEFRLRGGGKSGGHSSSENTFFPSLQTSKSISSSFIYSRLSCWCRPIFSWYILHSLYCVDDPPWFGERPKALLL